MDCLYMGVDGGAPVTTDLTECVTWPRYKCPFLIKRGAPALKVAMVMDLLIATTRIHYSLCPGPHLDYDRHHTRANNTISAS